MLRNKMITKFFLVLFGACVMGSAYGSSVIEPVYPTSKPSLPFTPGIKLSNGMLFVSGHIPYVNGEIPEYARDGKDDMADQAKIVMEGLRAVLDKAGYTFDDAVKVTVFMTDIKNYGAFNKVYATYWPGDKIPPAREAIEIGALPGGKPGAEVLVEVSLIAAK
ncbi:RidA family protein [Marinomonas sp. C2222]|uniref:RidA family protein n=1 Tax=Marinomonas sargassi TaxID=2984494 RepID=A0ABT2YTL5_9GAMM|nr:RidA family protein [Marinomonas sargassi]MCV2403211.1 RidA family protein [Marinomonas sargassi]